MSALSSIKNVANHTIAKIDAGESVASYAPLNRFVRPGLGLGIGLASTIFDYQQASDAESKRKVLIRDGLVITGVTLASIVAGYIVNRTEFAELSGSALKKFFSGMFQAGKEVAENHPHVHGAGAPFADSMLERVQALFKADIHDHGWEGAVKLTLLAALPIFAGGIPFGILADSINHEDWKKTGAMKVKESLFQFLGNITLCTVAILAFSKLGKGAINLLWKNPGFQEWGINSATKALGKLQALNPKDLSRIPAALTSGVEKILIEHRGNPDLIMKSLDDYMAHLFEDRWSSGLGTAWQEGYQASLAQLLSQKSIDRQVVHELMRSFFSEQMGKDLSEVLNNEKDLNTVAHFRLQSKGELAGVISGVFGGVVLGAWASNLLNHLLTHVFHLPEGHTVNGLFAHHHESNTEDAGWFAGPLGGRGIHWYDMILHLDDWPSALYMAGVEAVESLVQILYGISGLLAGTAGTNYASSTHPSEEISHHTDSNPTTEAVQTLQPWPGRSSWPQTQPWVNQTNPGYQPYFTKPLMAFPGVMPPSPSWNPYYTQPSWGFNPNYPGSFQSYWQQRG